MDDYPHGRHYWIWFLRSQAERLRRLTRGMVTSKVVTMDPTDAEIQQAVNQLIHAARQDFKEQEKKRKEEQDGR